MKILKTPVDKMKGNYFLIFILLLTLLNFYPALAQDITVTLANDKHSNFSISTTVRNNIVYFPIDDLVSALNLTYQFNKENKKVNFIFQGKEIIIPAFNPYLIIDNRVTQLPVNNIYLNGKIYVPQTFFLNTFTENFLDIIVYDKWNNNIEIKAFDFCNIKEIEIEEKINGTIIKIFTARDFIESDLSLRSRHGWLYVDLYGGKVDSSSLYQEFKDGIISKIVPSQLSEEFAQIGFRLRDELVEKDIKLRDPREIMVLLKSRKDISTDIAKSLEKEKNKWRIDKIVIDPGHGGKDPGAIGKKNNTYEKNVVLAISRYLKEILENELNINVLMTRDDDRYLELNQRAEFANKNGAKLFISIHANSNNNSRVHGVSTYFLGPNMTDEAREVAMLENSVIKYENESKYADLSHENLILSTMAQNVYNVESQDLADIVQQKISSACQLKDLGVKQANFYVLWGASMPNILVETAFISNAKEEKLLRSKSFQKEIASAIFQSIKEFKNKYESGL